MSKTSNGKTGKIKIDSSQNSRPRKRPKPGLIEEASEEMDINKPSNNRQLEQFG
jgi:hypothetical protein